MLHDRLRGQGSMTNVERILTLDYYTYYDPFFYFGCERGHDVLINNSVFVDTNTLLLTLHRADMDGCCLPVCSNCSNKCVVTHG